MGLQVGSGAERESSQASLPSEGTEKEGAENSSLRLISRNREDWEEARQVIVHENELINQRITWLLLSKAIIFTAFVGINTNSFTSAELAGPINIGSFTVGGLYVISIALIALSVVICLHSFVQIRGANAQIDEATYWWYRETIDCGENIQQGRNMYAKLNSLHVRLHYHTKMEKLFGVARHSKTEKRFGIVPRCMEGFLMQDYLPAYIMSLWIPFIVALVL